MPLRVDHVTICGAQLDPLQKAFADAGLAAAYGGPHANRLTHMALLGFEDGSYLELIAPHERNAQGSPWQKLMLGDAGPGAWAVGTKDMDAEVSRLRARGIEASGPLAGSRRRPDGKLLEWQTASAGPGPAGSLLPFMIQDFTPRQWRVEPSAALQGSGITGVAAVLLGVQDLESAAHLFQQACGWPAPRCEDHPEFGSHKAHFAGTPVILASPLDRHSWLAQRIAAFGETPAAFLLKTDDLRQVVKRFHLAGETKWFGNALAWFDAAKLSGVRLGVLQS